MQPNNVSSSGLEEQNKELTPSINTPISLDSVSPILPPALPTQPVATQFDANILQSTLNSPIASVAPVTLNTSDTSTLTSSNISHSPTMTSMFSNLGPQSIDVDEPMTPVSSQSLPLQVQTLDVNLKSVLDDKPIAPVTTTTSDSPIAEQTNQNILSGHASQTLPLPHPMTLGPALPDDPMAKPDPVIPSTADISAAAALNSQTLSTPLSTNTPVSLSQQELPINTHPETILKAPLELSKDSDSKIENIVMELPPLPKSQLPTTASIPQDLLPKTEVENVSLSSRMDHKMQTLPIDLHLTSSVDQDLKKAEVVTIPLALLIIIPIMILLILCGIIAFILLNKTNTNINKTSFVNQYEFRS